jgi:hypothetical protein
MHIVFLESTNYKKVQWKDSENYNFFSSHEIFAVKTCEVGLLAARDRPRTCCTFLNCIHNSSNIRKASKCTPEPAS